ncbi:MAG TPA: hypothetical protein VGS15_06205 [Candidatus Acidoferrales bacterium]|nr:hypothetical protein [Candidatus Acidoferrales bacterium]
MRVPQAPVYSDDLPMKQARDLYLAANGFRLGDYGAATFTIGIFGVSFRFPNIPSRKRAIPLHDLHHVLTGFDTNWIGEAEIGAWELRAGCNSFITYYLNGGGVVIGLFISPKRVWRAFRAARGQRTLYRDPLPYDRLLEMTVASLRSRLGIPPHGLRNDLS